MIFLVIVSAILLLGFTLFLFWGTRWGSTKEERSINMPGDLYFDNRSKAYVSMTRAISISARPKTVWPWLVQMGRGAGWYSIDWIDNGRKQSARHIISWIPEPHIGDASPIGYLRHIETGKALVWWVKGAKFMGATTRFVVDIHLAAKDNGSRLIIRMSADATVSTAHISLFFFRFIDSIMARKQLLGIKQRVEAYGMRTTNPEEPENGTVDQYQLYETIYASGKRAGVPGKEFAETWRQSAVDDGVIVDNNKSTES